METYAYFEVVLAPCFPFDIDDACEQLEKFRKYTSTADGDSSTSTKDLVKSIVSALDKVVIEYLHSITQLKRSSEAEKGISSSGHQ